ncbi:sulfite exporter TauE/SafE family protein [Persicobacter sp. CCB-QB2]|uniref:sulfite exporter TauE/SafE family protein n=1 Tax=Persicobacter sp. CCB-QB2 TaxID=1561025 RepID=UPI00092F9BFA|nr:sulfite exporter TauE/SafE family protein [Persicobacter sp. CCB-QB2]
MVLWSIAFLIGLMGSMHCIGMCGPISMALPMPDRKLGTVLKVTLMYNLARSFSYMLLGALLGIIGFGFSLAGTQQVLSIVMGALMLVVILLPQKYRLRLEQAAGNPVAGKIKKGFGYFFKKRTTLAFAGVGFLNGFLPCGLVYMALAGALAIGDWQQSALYMGIFGLGTWPMMVSVNLAGNWWASSQWRHKFYKAVPVFTFVIAVMFILRGLNLGIPYLSPEIRVSAGEQIEACD